MLREVSPPGVNRPEQWKIPLNRFRDMVEAIVRDPSTSPEMANAASASLWLAQVEAFREGEEDLMLSGKYESTLDDHRVFLSDMIANGEAIVVAVRREGMALKAFTVDDLQATLDSLHTTFNCEHGPKNSQKTNEFLDRLFNGPKP